MAKLLRQKGHETAIAGNGEEGIQQLRRSTPDLVVLDHLMPKVDGLTFLASIRRFPKWKHLPVVMLTGLKDRSHLMKAQALGVREYLVKADYSATELLEHIQRHIETDSPNAQPLAGASTLPLG